MLSSNILLEIIHSGVRSSWFIILRNIPSKRGKLKLYNNHNTGHFLYWSIIAVLKKLHLPFKVCVKCIIIVYKRRV